VWYNAGYAKRRNNYLAKNYSIGNETDAKMIVDVLFDLKIEQIEPMSVEDVKLVLAALNQDTTVHSIVEMFAETLDFE